MCLGTWGMRKAQVNGLVAEAEAYSVAYHSLEQH